MKKELQFLHITKNAGTFIEDIADKNNIKWGRFNTSISNWHNYLDLYKLSLLEKYDWFVVVRNPYSRILSEYYCKWGGIGEKNIVHNKREFNTTIQTIMKNNPFHEDKDLKIGDKNIKIYSYHYTEQYKYVESTIHNLSNVKIHILKFENLNNELQNLFNEYNIDIDVNKYKKINSKEDHNKVIKFTVNDFEDETIKKINTIYKKDFELFGYEMKKI